MTIARAHRSPRWGSAQFQLACSASWWPLPVSWQLAVAMTVHPKALATTIAACSRQCPRGPLPAQAIRPISMMTAMMPEVVSCKMYYRDTDYPTVSTPEKYKNDSYATTTEWPHPLAAPERWYLHGDGGLSRTAPVLVEPAFTMTNPEDPYGRAYRADGILGFEIHINDSTVTEAVVAVQIEEVSARQSFPITNGQLLASLQAGDKERSRFLAGEMIQPFHYHTQDLARGGITTIHNSPQYPSSVVQPIADKRFELTIG